MSRFLVLTVGASIVYVLQLIIAPLVAGFEVVPFLVFALAILLVMGSSRQSVFYGMIFAFVGELLSGLNVGVYVVPFLVAVLVFMGIQRLIDIKPMMRDGSWRPDNLVLLLCAGLAVLLGALAAQFILSVFFEATAWSLLPLLWRWPVLVYNVSLLMLVAVVLGTVIHEHRSDF